MSKVSNNRGTPGQPDRQPVMVEDPKSSRRGREAWRQISPRFDLGATARRHFAWFFVVTSFVVLIFGMISGGFAGGLFLILGYWLVVPGLLGIGWFFIFLAWVGIGYSRDHKRTLEQVKAVFETNLQPYGPVQYMDFSLDGEVFTGIALAQSSLVVVQDGQMRKLLWQEVSSWRWEIGHTSQLVGQTDAISRLEFRGKEQRALAATNGFFLVTRDPDRPQIHFRTSSEEVCLRWQVILENIQNGSTSID